MKKSFQTILSSAVVLLGVLCTWSCTEKKFHVNGNITDAKDSTLYFENVGLSGPIVIDSVKLSQEGNFHFSSKATEAPEFYRLRIAGQIINVSIDSTETIEIKASYPEMASKYTIKGSDNCLKIQELTLKQLTLQEQVQAITKNPNLGFDAVNDSVNKILTTYKEDVKLNYIFKEPMKAYAYFALFQTINPGNGALLVFNPRQSADDVKIYAAVATSWDTYYPQAERGKNLHNIALENMKNVRILTQQQQQVIDASQIRTLGIIDIALPSNKGNVVKLSDLKGKVVILDFHVFASAQSTQRIMMLRELYNKYHDQGFEIYQVSLDGNEHFWKTKTSALPWINVHANADTDQQVLINYNVQTLPTFFLIDKNNTLQKRDVQIKDIDEAIRALL